MRIGIIGTGGMGVALARRLAGCGHTVAISNSRGPQTLIALAAGIGAHPVTVGEAAGASDIVIVAIPTKAVPDLAPGLFAGTSAGAVIDTTNYHPTLRDGQIDALDQGMVESAWVAEQLGHPVVKAFNNVFAESLAKKGLPDGRARRLALSVAGDQADAKAAALGLVDELGFDPVDAGGIAESWRQQPGTPAYCQDLDAATLGRALEEADPGLVAEYRVREEARIRAGAEMATPKNAR